MQTQPDETPASRLNQIVGSLKVCLSPDLNQPPREDNASCFQLHSGDSPIEHELGVFQNFPIMKGERQIYLARPISRDPKGNQPGAAGRALIFDVEQRHIRDRATGPVKLVHDRPFSISDNFDPMMPMTRDKHDLRLLSVKASLGKAGIHEIDLAADKPETVPVPIVLRSGAGTLDLHESWARRPVLVVASDPMNESQSKTQLFLSRSKITTAAESKVEDAVRFEFLVLERGLEKDKPILRYARGLACKITYKFALPHPFKPCRRSSETAGPYHPTPTQMLQGAQLLVGRFKSYQELGETPTELSVALPDACFEKDPIILRPVGANEASGPKSFAPISSVAATLNAGAQKIERTIECAQLQGQEQIANEM